jgi:hypothetical protein
MMYVYGMVNLRDHSRTWLQHIAVMISLNTPPIVSFHI